MQSPSLFLSLFLCQLLQVFIKPRIGDIHTVCPGNLCFSLCRHACNGKSHGNTVVQMTVQNSSIKCFAACNDHTVFSRYNVTITRPTSTPGSRLPATRTIRTPTGIGGVQPGRATSRAPRAPSRTSGVPISAVPLGSTIRSAANTTSTSSLGSSRI